MGLPADLVFRTKGQLGIDILAEAIAEGVRLDFVCGDVVLGLAFGDLPESEQRSCRGLWLILVGGMPSALDVSDHPVTCLGYRRQQWMKSSFDPVKPGTRTPTPRTGTGPAGAASSAASRPSSTQSVRRRATSGSSTG
jgi:hypothetical protein